MKKLFLYFFMFNALLLNFFAQAMKLSQQPNGVEIDWACKKRDLKSVCCWVEKNDQKYPYFLDKDDHKVNPSFVSDQTIAQKDNKFLGGEYDISSFTNEQKSTLWYVLNTLQAHKPLRIEGRDKKFAQAMSQRVEKLPLEIRKTIVQKYGVDMLCNTEYEPSSRDVLLDDEWNKNDCAHITSEWGMCACSAAWQCCALNNSIGYNRLFLCCSLATIMYFQHWVHSKAMIWLSETPEKKDQRHGFVAVPLLTDMEYKIVEATKDKVD